MGGDEGRWERECGDGKVGRGDKGKWCSRILSM